MPEITLEAGKGIIPEIIGPKREMLEDGRMAIALESKMIPEQTIVIPAHPEYPSLRHSFPNGTFPPGCVVVLSAQVFDADGNDISPADNTWKMPLDKYVADESKEVLGVLYFDWAESNKAV